MPVRVSKSHKLIRRRGRYRADDSARAAGAPGALASGAPEDATRERRDRDPAQDTAVYNCACGMVFEAPVCTSVDCPHCGGHQAW